MLAYAAWGQFCLPFDSNVPGTTGGNWLNMFGVYHHLFCLEIRLCMVEVILTLLLARYT